MKRYLLAAALMLAASPAMAWCGNTATNCASVGGSRPTHYRAPTLEEQVRNASNDIDDLRSEIEDLKIEVRKLKAAQP